MNYFKLIKKTINAIDVDEVDLLIDFIASIKSNNGRLFILGAGGSAGTAGHAVNDFRKLCNIEAYSPSDNVSELTARVNDDGWDTCYLEWLKVSKFNSNDAILIISVGGGNKIASQNIVKCIEYSNEIGATTLGIVGKTGGMTKALGDVTVMIPMLYEPYVTPITESIHSVILHAIVSDSRLQENPTKW
jgi:D-sedoheptulose 7-phosphate isomerase